MSFRIDGEGNAVLINRQVFNFTPGNNFFTMPRKFYSVFVGSKAIDEFAKPSH